MEWLGPGSLMLIATLDRMSKAGKIGVWSQSWQLQMISYLVQIEEEHTLQISNDTWQGLGPHPPSKAESSGHST